MSSCPQLRSVAMLVAAALALTPHVAGAAPVTVKDSAGRQVVINNAERIVSVGGAITEILYAFGREKQIVAVDSTSLYPESALKEKRDVGYMRQLSPEGVLGLNPSLILAIEGAGPKETINVIEASGIPMVSVPDRHTGPGVIEKINLIAAAIGAPSQGECVAAAVKADLDGLSRAYAQIAKPAKVMFVLSMAGDRLLVAGKETAADGIIKLAGAVNVMSGYDGYKAVNDEAIINAAPEFILTMQRGCHPMSTDEVFAHAAFKLTPAAAHKAHVSLDGLYMLGFGPRTALAARDLAATFYPQVSAKLPSEAKQAASGCRE